LKVIGAGLPRTATTTQMVVLEQLGFGPCYHMRNVLMDLENQLPKWEAVQDGNPDWADIFGDAQSTVDWPSARYYEDLMEVYPDAKILLSERDGESWVKSMRETVWGVYFGESVLRHVSSARACIDPQWRRYLDVMNRMNWEEGASMAGDHHSDQGLIDIMNRWNEGVKATVPSDRLLSWYPTDGWEPLCEFLEVPVPDGPVPKLNDTRSFQEGIIGGGLALLNGWWDEREKPEHGLHGAPVDD
jgi:Sulfotransferase domain